MDWLEYLKQGLKNVGSFLVEGATYDPEGTIGRYMAGQEAIDGESPITVSKKTKQDKEEFADNNWVLGYAPLATAAGMSAFPYLLPGTAGGNIIGLMAGSMATGEAANLVSLAATGRTFGENVLNAVGYYGGDGFWGDLYRAGTEMLNPWYFTNPTKVWNATKATVQAIPQATSGNLNAFWGPSEYKNFYDAYINELSKNPDLFNQYVPGRKGAKFLTPEENNVLMRALKDKDFSNIPLLNTVLRKLAQEFYKLLRLALVGGRRGKPSGDLKLQLAEFDLKVILELAKFDNPNFIIGKPLEVIPKRRPRIGEKSKAPILDSKGNPMIAKNVVVEVPAQIEQGLRFDTAEEAANYLLEHEVQAVDLLKDAVRRSNIHVKSYNTAVQDFGADFASGRYVSGKDVLKYPNLITDRITWNYVDDYNRFVKELAESKLLSRVDKSKLMNLVNNAFLGFKHKYVYHGNPHISSVGYTGLDSNKAKLLLNTTDVDIPEIFGTGNARGMHYRFYQLFDKFRRFPTWDILNNTKIKAYHTDYEGHWTGKERKYGIAGLTYSSGKEAQALLWNYLRDTLGRYPSLNEYNLFIGTLAKQEGFLHKLFHSRKIHGGRYDIESTTGELQPRPDDYLKWLKLPAVAAAASTVTSKEKSYKKGGSIKRCKKISKTI